jgi:hypothetical protein
MAPTFAQPRSTQPRLWRSLALASATVTLATMPALAQNKAVPLAQILAHDATLWLAQAEGGEGGEAGAVASATPDVAYLARLAIVEGHLRAALDLYRKGLVDEAVGLSYHPEAEMMDDVRADLAAHAAADITPAMTAFSATLEAAAPVPEVEAALAAVQSAIAAAMAPKAGDLRVRFDTLTALLRAAASEYASSTEGGSVGDVMAYHESHAFIATARSLAAELALVPAAKDAADRALAAMAEADGAFGDMSLATYLVSDPAILLAVAARVELIASSVR